MTFHKGHSSVGDSDFYNHDLAWRLGTRRVHLSIPRRKAFWSLQIGRRVWWWGQWRH